VNGQAVPGGFACTWGTFNDVTIVDPAHAIVTTPHAIADADLDGWRASTHGYFSTVPAGAHEIVEIAGTGQPCAMDLAFGSGRIVATCQTVEWTYASHNYLENMLLYGAPSFFRLENLPVFPAPIAPLRMHYKIT